jgi:hypothetical protein
MQSIENEYLQENNEIIKDYSGINSTINDTKLNISFEN